MSKYNLQRVVHLDYLVFLLPWSTAPKAEANTVNPVETSDSQSICLVDNPYWLHS